MKQKIIMIPLSNIFFVCFPTETLSCVAYIRYKRIKGKKERRRWTEAVDNRIGAHAAICNSIAVGKRSFSFSFRGIHPSSTFAVDVEGEVENEKRPMSQMHTGASLCNPITPLSTECVSCVSCAPNMHITCGSESSIFCS